MTRAIDCSHDGREEKVAEQRAAASHCGRDEDEDRGDEHEVGERLPEPVEEVGEAREERDERALDRRRRDRDDGQDRQEEGRQDELDGVARAPGAGFVDRASEEADAVQRHGARPQPPHAAEGSGAAIALERWARSRCEGLARTTALTTAPGSPPSTTEW